MTQLRLAFATALLSFAMSSSAHANVGQEFGFGARTAALGGAGVAWGSDGYWSYANPAGLALGGEKRLVFSWGIVDYIPSFDDISNVITQNSYNSDVASPTSGNIANDYRATFGQQLGISYDFFPDFHRITLGLTSFLPLAQTAYVDTGEDFEPEYFLYRDRTLRPQFEVGLGGQANDRLMLGAGFHVGFSITGNATVFLQTDDTKSSSMRLLTSLKPKVAPYVGVLYVSDPEAARSSAVDSDFQSQGDYTWGATVRFPLTSELSVDTESSASLLGGSANPNIDFTTDSGLYYDPLTVELGGTYQPTTNSRMFLQLDYQRWSRFQAPAITIPNAGCSTSGCGITIAPIQFPGLDLRDTVVPRIAGEMAVRKLTLRAGYSYHMSIIRGVPDGPGNYLDPNRHCFDAGVGLKFLHFLSTGAPWRLDFNVTYEPLVSQTITKTAGDETGDTSSQKIGAPGYEAGGKIWGGGVSLSVAL